LTDPSLSLQDDLALDRVVCRKAVGRKKADLVTSRDCIRAARSPARHRRHQARAGSLAVVTASNIRHLTDVSA
jgi:hypothetical protein